MNNGNIYLNPLFDHYIEFVDSFNGYDNKRKIKYMIHKTDPYTYGDI